MKKTWLDISPSVCPDGPDSTNLLRLSVARLSVAWLPVPLRLLVVVALLAIVLLAVVLLSISLLLAVAAAAVVILARHVCVWCFDRDKKDPGGLLPIASDTLVLTWRYKSTCLRLMNGRRMKHQS